ncbi:MAG: hypothetical protein IJX27_07730 [Clostridia bacterium]|nr:hypothetical protein [Clostridia bacterium]
MNNNSVICRFIAEHPEEWEDLLLKEYGIKVKKDGRYAIFNYKIECDFANPIVQEARGIIIDCEWLEVACWPFRKFGNHNESYADTIDWESARVLEKVDGSIIKLWYDFEAEKWQFSTNGSIRAEKAPVDDYEGIYFGTIISRADNYGEIPFDRLDKENTYIFELVSPETQVVVNYGSASLYHIGTRSNKTGEECELDIGIKKPASYPLGSLEECLHAAAELNRGSGEDISKEGFVVVDKNWHRVKVKSPDYLMMHRLVQINTLAKRDYIEMIRNNDGKIGIICEANPHLLPSFKYYEFKLAELKYQADRIGVIANSLYREYGGDRGAVAKIILKHKLAAIGFLCIDRGKSGGEILMGLPIEKLAKFIPDYEPEDMYSLFLADGK